MRAALGNRDLFALEPFWRDLEPARRAARQSDRECGSSDR